MAVVVAVAVVVALVGVVAVVGGIRVVVASAVAAVVVSPVGSDDCIPLSFPRCENPPPRFLH